VFQSQGQSISIDEGQRLLQGAQTQLTQAQTAAAAATQKERSYASAHSQVTTGNDPQYAQLDQERLQADTTVQSIQSTISTLNQEIADEGTGGNTFAKVLDAPEQLAPRVSRSKDILTGGGIGVAVGLLVCIIYLLIIVRRDRALYSVADVQRAVSFPILMQVPQLHKGSKELVMSGIGKS